MDDTDTCTELKINNEYDSARKWLIQMGLLGVCAAGFEPHNFLSQILSTG